METLRTSPFVRLLVVSFFVAGLGVLVRYLPGDSAFRTLQDRTSLGAVAMLAILAASIVHFKVELPAAWLRNSRVLLVYLLLLIQLGLFYLVNFVVVQNGLASDDSLYFAPHALAAITLTLLMGTRFGFFAAIYGSLWTGLIAPGEQSLTFLIVSLGVGLVGVLVTRHLRKRSQLMRAGLYIGAAALVLCIILGHMTPVRELWAGRLWHEFARQAGWLVLAGIFTVTLVNGLLPLLEGLFKITTTISWIELSDLNHPLLRRMTLEAPGTYHHSLMVASLAERAAESIGAEPTICRVCSYFHDIGKIERPEYWIENMHGDDNPHDDLSPNMSALIVLAHVKDGVDLALKHKLNREIIDAIQQHHGTSLVWFFYRRAMDFQEEVRKQVAAGKASATDVPEVSEEDFRYPGPKPQSRESAIISMADAVESASRVLTKPTPQKIEQLVDEIVQSRIRDGQLDDCDLTLGELEKVRTSFVNTLRTMHHRRIPYPDEKDGADKQDKSKVREKEKEPPADKAKDSEKDRDREPPDGPAGSGRPKRPGGSGSDQTEIWDRPAPKPRPSSVSPAANVMENAETARFGIRPAS